MPEPVTTEQLAADKQAAAWKAQPSAPDLNPASEVRIAADLLRSFADSATPGPWTVSAVRSPRSHVTSAVYSNALPPGSEVVGSTLKKGGCWRPADAEYIALMNPLVARTMAELLTHLSDEMDGGDAVDQIPSGAGVDGLTRWDWTSALELARTIIGTAGGT